jgi:predicted HicB family RNase H-like nuclease
MPNAPKTPTRTVRVSDEIWTAAKEKAAIEGRTLTEIVIAALKDYTSA